MTMRVPPGHECGVSTPRYIAPSGPEGGTIDLRNLNWIEPAGLVTIAAHAQRMATQQVVRLLGPTNPSRARYLSRMGLAQLLDDLRVVHDLPDVNINSRDNLIELTRFDGTAGAVSLAEMVFHHLSGQDLVLATHVHQAICELGTNVPEHAGVEGGFLAAQMTHGGTQIRFAVADAGAGLLVNMRHAGARDDLEALQLAVQRRVTSTGSVHRGKGLSRVMELVHATGGYLHLSSGRAGLTLHPKHTFPDSRDSRFRGTMIQGLLRCA